MSTDQELVTRHAAAVKLLIDVWAGELPSNVPQPYWDAMILMLCSLTDYGDKIEDIMAENLFAFQSVVKYVESEVAKKSGVKK